MSVSAMYDASERYSHNRKLDKNACGLSVLFLTAEFTSIPELKCWGTAESPRLRCRDQPQYP